MRKHMHHILEELQEHLPYTIFSAVTGLYILSSSMNPVYHYDLVSAMETFLRNKCTNTSFLDKYQLSVIYAEADNQNLTKIHENVYLYPGVKET